ncbi:mid1-interacting protein 1A isoform X1 [Andrena cerasifolii]|uniref:mid1-interacting protein 1A isoform X1 n=1 Tax=Andrena cerasifolii TaxID=2819439 RepID=UPI004038291A
MPYRMHQFDPLFKQYLSFVQFSISGVLMRNMLCKRENLERLLRHNEPEFSKASIFKSMERFLRRVNEMEETILIPSRLLDLTAGDSDDRVNLEGKHGSIVKMISVDMDLRRLYNIITQMKIELLWSKRRLIDIQELKEDFVPAHKSMNSRYSSTASIQSVQSTWTSSDSESDTSIEGSVLASEYDADAIAKSFQRHLRGLHHSIQKMTLAAEYLTMRYQADITSQM